MANPARALWTLIEPLHAVTYFSPEARAAFTDAGLRGFWRGYFAGRAAPFGAVGPAPVTAVFAGFAPSMVERALPSVWELADPPSVLALRRDGAVAALRRLLGDAPAGAVEEAASLLREAVSSLPLAGRPLGAANAALPADDDPWAELWQAATTLREHRGDGHVAAQLASGVAGLDALLLRAGADLSRALLQPARGWTDEQWDAGVVALQARGLLDADAEVTPEGTTVLRVVETMTDFAAAAPWSDPERTAATGRALAPLARACLAELPQPSPIGSFSAWDPVGDPHADAVTTPF